MASYLIPYLDPKKNDGEEDPMLTEYTYGDVEERGRILSKNVKQGDFLFFHTTYGDSINLQLIIMLKKCVL